MTGGNNGCLFAFVGAIARLFRVSVFSDEETSRRMRPFQLWEQAKGDRDEYLRLMKLHGHVWVDNEPCGICGGMFRHRHADSGLIVRTDIFGHDER